jgi:hypothetical protein
MWSHYWLTVQPEWHLNSQASYSYLNIFIGLPAFTAFNRYCISFNRHHFFLGSPSKTSIIPVILADEMSCWPWIVLFCEVAQNEVPYHLQFWKKTLLLCRITHKYLAGHASTKFYFRHTDTSCWIELNLFTFYKSKQVSTFGYRTSQKITCNSTGNFSLKINII